RRRARAAVRAAARQARRRARLREADAVRRRRPPRVRPRGRRRSDARRPRDRRSRCPGRGVRAVDARRAMTARYTITAALRPTAHRATMAAADPTTPAREVAILRAPEPEGVRWFTVDLRASLGIRHPNLVELIDIAYTAADEGRDEAAYFI